MNRVYNFSAGPSTLPLEVLEKAAKELVCYKDTGMSVMEMSHRSKAYQEIIDNAENNLRKLMNVPKNYKILFLQGGASSQFAMVPMNLLNKSKKADYIVTGAFAKKALAEAKKYGDINVVATSEDETFSYIPKVSKDQFREDADYVHITLNNTIYGTTYKTLPDTGDAILVTDASSNILSEEIDVSKFGIIYAGAQKNMGPAGVTVVIIREDLIGNALDITPSMFNYEGHAKAGSMMNTPPTYSIYMAGLVFEWLLDLGGLKKMGEMNKEKSSLLYDYLEGSDFYKATANKEDRSMMNITFKCATPELDAEFIAFVGEKGFVNIKGHRSVGGMRASIYNAFEKEGVVKLVEAMKEFEASH